MDQKTIIKDFIQTEILHGRNISLKDDEDLLSAGILDSLSILKIVAFVEERFNFSVPDEDVVFDNFSSINALAEYVQQHGH